MPTAIILGLPRAQADRVKGELKKSQRVWREGWSVHFVPPTGAHSLLREADVRTALLNARGTKDSAHVFAISNQGGDRKQSVASQFTPQFRFRWLPGQWLALPFPTPAEFIDNVDSTLAEEDDWRQAVQPNDVQSPLLLPEPSFDTKLRDLWELALKYGDGSVQGSLRRQQEFERIHYASHTAENHQKDFFWTDDARRIFDHTGPQHGEAPDERKWKFSYRIPNGFHYDLSHADGRKFTANGAVKQESVKAGKYINIDAYGYFRSSDG